VQRIFQSKIDLVGIQNLFMFKMKRKLSIYQLLFIVIILLFIVLTIGAVGFHYVSDMNWLDSIHHSALYLAGIGPIYEIKTTREKVFSTFYAILASVFVLTIIIFVVDRVLQLEIV
jgi:preprotein translocase subunit SecE